MRLYRGDATPLAKPAPDLQHPDAGVHYEAPHTPSKSTSREALLREVLTRQSHGNSDAYGKQDIVRTSLGGNLVGLSVNAFTDDFDRRFDVHSGKIQDILGDCDEPPSQIPTRVRSSWKQTQRESEGIKRGSSYGASDVEKWRADFDKQKLDPVSWCIPVRFVLRLWEHICEDLLQYAAAHCCDKHFRHVCLAPCCTWHHAEEPVSLDAESNVSPLGSDMHLVVQRYVKPWTETFKDAGLALVLKAGHQSLHRQSDQELEDGEQQSVFISHCWNEDFKKFVKTLKNSFDLQTHVWVCSFALWQHGNVEGQLGSVEESPFAVALAKANRVLVVTDQSIEEITRCWCVLEATLSMKWGLPYDVCLAENLSLDSWSKVTNAVDSIDLKHCSCSVQKDKDAILEYAEEGDGGIEGLNEVVRQVFRKASQRARLTQAALQGNLEVLEKAGMNDVRELKDARGRGIMHMAAIRGQLSSMMYLGQHLGQSFLDMVDNDGMSPLCVAAHAGSTAGVQGLLVMEANLEGSSAGGLTPLHYAAIAGSTKIALMLVNHRADVEAQGKYRSSFGRRPLHLAAKEGHAEVTRLLLQRSADCNAFAKNGATVLWHAVHAGHTNVVVALVTAKSDVNRQNNDKYKRVPLMAAVKRESVALVSILIGAHADVSTQDANHDTPRDYCLLDSSQDAEFILDLIQMEQARKSRKCHGCALS